MRKATLSRTRCVGTISHKENNSRELHAHLLQSAAAAATGLTRVLPAFLQMVIMENIAERPAPRIPSWRPRKELRGWLPAGWSPRT